MAIGGNYIACSDGGATDDCVRSEDRHTITRIYMGDEAIAQCYCAGNIGADIITLDNVFITIRNSNATAAIAGDDVSRASYCATNCGIGFDDVYAMTTVTQGYCAGDIGANIVASDYVIAARG